MTMFIEEIYESNVPIKYIFEEGKKNKDNLIIIFSNSNGHDEDELNNYDYLNELNVIDSNKLFILDNYGPEGCYYLGANLNFEVETSVVSLISYISNFTSVPFKEIITVGTNKGGSAALYFGLKYNMGKIFVSNPFIKIADHILRYSRPTAEYLLGFTPSKFEIDKLNKLIINQLNKTVFPELNILSYMGDNISNQTDLLVKELNARNISFDLTEKNEVESIGNIEKEFLQFLLINLVEISNNINIKNIIFNKNIDGNCLLKIDSDNKTWINKFDIRLILKNENGLIKEFKMKDEFQISHCELKELSNQPEIINFEISITRNSRTILEIPVDQMLIGNDFILKGTELSIVEDALYFRLDIENSPGIDFAYYIRKNNKIIEKIMYNSASEIKVPIKTHGNYQVQYFIRDKETGNKLLSQKTEYIKVNNALLALK